MIFNTPDRITALTPRNPFGRMPDGRPMVPDDILERMKLVTNDEAWGTMESGHGYRYQFTGGWLNMHPDRVLVGRVVTAQFVPIRPDLHEVVAGIGEREGRSGGQNTWVIDSLGPNDVLVVDIFGKIRDGTVIGDNLSTAIASKTKAGIVINGSVRDYVRIRELENFNVFHKGMDPTPIREVTLAGVNIPIRIDDVTVMPGDVVLGTPEGLSFVPPHLAQQVVEESENTRQRDVFGKLRLHQGTYTTGEIDRPNWAEHIEADYVAWVRTM